MSGEERAASGSSAPGPSAALEAGPVDPDELRRLARRRFFRSLAADAMKTAATVVGAAGALRDGSVEMASAILGTADATGSPAGSGARPAGGAAGVFRSAFRFEPERVVLLDQRRLPDELSDVDCLTGSDVAQAIRDSVVRGAPLLGQVAACGIALTANRSMEASLSARRSILFGTANALRNAAPTAAPVRNAMDRMLARYAAISDAEGDGARVAAGLRQEAEAIIGEATLAHAGLASHGAAFFAASVPPGDGATLRILTIGSTGALAGGQVGTGLAIVAALRDAGRPVEVLVAETRPWLAGARLVAWELVQAGIPFVLVGDGAAAGLLGSGAADAVLVGAESIARDGDVACDPGSFALAVVAARRAVPFVVAAPLSTCDGQAAEGSALRAAQRPPEEVLFLRGARLAPEGTIARNPSVDVIPSDLVTAVVTETGVLLAPYPDRLAAAADRSRAEA